MIKKEFQQISAIIAIILMLTSCAYPVVDPEKPPKCKVYTKALTLDFTGYDFDLQDLGGATDPRAVIILPFAAAIVTFSSLIISSSIVVINNSIHWVEQEGTCEDGVIRKYTTAFIDKATELGGYQLEPTEPLIKSIEENYSQAETLSAEEL